MKQAKRRNQWYLGMNVHIDVDAESGLVHRVICTAASVNDVKQDCALLHGEEEAAIGDAGYQGVHKRPEPKGPAWHVAMCPGLQRKPNPFIHPQYIAEQIEYVEVSLRAKVEDPFRARKRRLCRTNVRYRGLKRNTAQIVTLFALENQWLARRQLLGAMG